MNEKATAARRLPWLSWIDTVSVWLGVLGGVACVLLMLNVVADVIGRVFFRPLPGTLDLVQFAWMPMIASLGLGYALMKGQHIRIGLLTDSGTSRLQRVVEVFSMAASLLTIAALAWYAMERAVMSTRLLEHPVTSPWLLTWVVRWVLVLGLVGLVLQIIAQLTRALTVPDFHFEDEEAALLAGEELRASDVEELAGVDEAGIENGETRA